MVHEQLRGAWASQLASVVLPARRPAVKTCQAVIKLWAVRSQAAANFLPLVCRTSAPVKGKVDAGLQATVLQGSNVVRLSGLLLFGVAAQVSLLSYGAAKPQMHLCRGKLMLACRPLFFRAAMSCASAASCSLE